MKLIQDAARFYRKRILPLLKLFHARRAPSKLKGRTYPKDRVCPWCFALFSEIGIKLHQRKCEKRPVATGEIVRPTDFDLPIP